MRAVMRKRSKVMCGIAGFLNASFNSGDALTALRGMGDSIAHRGPDGRGEWFCDGGNIGLAHRRLAIVDLTSDGAQPMRSPCGRYTIAFNGEIYNYRAIRLELEKGGSTFAWWGHSDTEVLIAAIVQWGFTAALSKCNGMFAIALWDAKERNLLLARDRFGEKPLYYGWNGNAFLFGSELKALRAFPGWNGALDNDAVRSYLQLSYIPTPRSIYRGIFKLPPGTWLSIGADSEANQIAPPQVYWSAMDVINGARNSQLKCTVPETLSLLDTELRRAVALRMHADVSLGSFLSGGVDSALVTAMMQAQSTKAVRTFSLGVSDANYDESSYARNVARHLGTDHTEFIATPRELLSVVPLMPAMYDEPFSDSSQIPTHLVARLARQHVTVALTGDAGDELFGGYNRHVAARRLALILAFLPVPVRQSIGNFLQTVSARTWDRLNSFSSAVTSRPPSRIVGHKLHKVGRALASLSREDLYRQLVCLPNAGSFDNHRLLSQPELLCSREIAGFEFSEQMMATDVVTYLPDDILTKVDRATMAVALEGRMPFLDPNVFSLAWRIPLGLKIRGSAGKWILRKVLHNYVPRVLVDRPKSGFGVPIGTWLRGSLREWGECHLGEAALDRSGLLNTQMIRRVWTSHLAGADGFEHDLWAVLMLQVWLEHNHYG
jgi:asparagine synthase (glutamine-hydrolysing)